MLGFHRRLVRRCEWLTLMPNDGCLPHTSHTAAMTRHLCLGLAEDRATVLATPPGSQLVAAARERRPPAPRRSPTIHQRDHPRPPRRRRPARGGGGLPRRPGGPPGGDQPAQRLPGARRRHRHQHGAHARVGVRRARRRRRRPGRRVQGDQPRLAHGRPGQLGRDPLADPAGLRRRGRRGRRASTAPTRRRGARPRRPTAAYEAVMRPVEGTILTVVREAAEAAEARRPTAAPTWSPCSTRPATGAPTRSARTPELLPVLKEAGVVDAGGAGFLLLLDVLLHVVDGRPVPEPRGRRGRGARRRPPGARRGRRARRRRRPTCATRSCTSSRRPTRPSRRSRTCGPASATRSWWSGGDGIWNCHIHTDDIGAPIEAAIDVGRPRKIRVTDLIEQVEEERWVREAAGAPSSRCRRTPRRRSPPRWWPWPPATASAASSTRSACRASSPAASR